MALILTSLCCAYDWGSELIPAVCIGLGIDILY